MTPYQSGSAAAALLAGVLLAAGAAAQAPRFGDQILFEDVAEEGAPSFASVETAGQGPDSLLRNGEVVPAGVTTIVRTSRPRPCTATLVGRRTMLTAAHCLEKRDGRLADGLSLVISGERASARCMRLSSYPANSAHDWAICQLGREVRNMRFERIDPESSIRVNQGVVLTGYGCTENGRSDGKLRYGFATIVDPATGIRGGPRPGFIATNNVDPETAKLCSGDSGGPVFRFLSDLGTVTWNGCRRQIATNTSVAPSNSFYSPLKSGASRELLKAYVEKTREPVCGWNTGDEDPKCRC